MKQKHVSLRFTPDQLSALVELAGEMTTASYIYALIENDAQQRGVRFRRQPKIGRFGEGRREKSTTDRRAITPEQRQHVLLLNKKGLTRAGIGDATGLSQPTIRKILAAEGHESRPIADSNPVTEKMAIEMRTLRADGRSYAEIAEILGVTKRTVINHLKQGSSK